MMVICWLLNIVYAMIMVLLSPWMLYRMIAQGRYRQGWKDRFGFVTRRYSQQPCIWIHAVSMGEINAIGTMVRQLERVLPQYEIVISSTTDTGMACARKLYGTTHRIFFFPWDFSCAVRRTFRRIRPELCILMELEVWHNFTALAERFSIPVIVANGRISSGKGFPRYRRIAPLVRPMFARLALVLAQDDQYAQRFRFLGVPSERVQVVGSLKYDTAQPGVEVPGARELAVRLRLDRQPLIWVAGSTGPGEEEIILESFEQLRCTAGLERLRLIIVPRKPERFDTVARLIESHGHRLLRYSDVKADSYHPDAADDTAVILGDTMGDLRKFYYLADVIFVGRSLIPMGGSDMMEAALGPAVVVGPHTENFQQTVTALCRAKAMEIARNAGELTEITRRLLQDRDDAKQMGQRARQVIIDNQGATRRSVAAIAELLGYRMPRREGGIAQLIVDPTGSMRQ